MKFEDVKYGSKGTSVIVCQTLLRAMQYLGADGYPLEIDGIAGSNTCHAILSFQKAQIAYDNNVGYDSIFGERCWETILGRDYA